MEITQAGDVAVLTLDEGLGNAITPGLVSDLDSTLDEIRQDDPPALVVTGTGGMFSPGLALPILINYSRAELREFMAGFGAALRNLLTLPLPTVAAINGHAIAGGCVLAVMCDRRLMVEERARIGLTEVQLGASLPSIVSETLRLRVPPATVARIMLAGERFQPDEALEIGLVDELVGRDDLLEHADEVAEAMVRPGSAYAQIKADLLAPALRQMTAADDRQLDGMMDTWFSEAAQQRLDAVVRQLDGKG